MLSGQIEKRDGMIRTKAEGQVRLTDASFISQIDLGFGFGSYRVCSHGIVLGTFNVRVVDGRTV